MYTYRAKKNHLPASFAAGLLLLATAPVAAQEIQSLEAIRAAVEHYLAASNPPAQGRQEIVVGKLDPRLRLAACHRALSVFPPPGSHLRGNTTIGVSCENNKPWKLYVPVSIRVYKPVLAANRFLPRGAVIQAGDLQIIESDITTLGRGYFSEDDQVVGKVVKQPLMTGKVVEPYHIGNPKIVRRGESVTILASSDGFEIRMKGKAMMDGTSGELIKVKNEKSKRIVEGKVIASGIVKVLF